MKAPQVDKTHYGLGYAYESRFASYYWQLFEVLSRSPKSVLEVGVGDQVFGQYIRNNTDIAYTSLDLAADLSPDVLGSVTAMPFKDKSYDMACAFEVLEHLPFEEFETALDELCRVAERYVVLSLPHFGPMLSLSWKIPFMREVRMAWKIPYPKAHTFNGEHYWEIGKRGYPASRIRACLAARGKLIADYVPFGSAYHHFFVLDVSGDTIAP